ncbi:MAG: DUF4956 domain-containing protein [Acholeplasmataceae bacterium]
MTSTIYWVLTLEPLKISTLLIVLLMATLLGAMLAFSYHLSHLKDGYDKSFLFTLLIMPLVVSIIVLLVSNNLARAFSLAGVFTLVRFRLAMNDSSDLGFILASVGVGLSIALGYVLLGIIITTFLSVVLAVLSQFLLQKKQSFAKLVFYIPEQMNIKGVVDDVLATHTKSFRLNKIRSTEFGTLYKLTYKIILKKDRDTKELMDAIRHMNGNLDVTLYEDYHLSYEEKI